MTVDISTLVPLSNYSESQRNLLITAAVQEKIPFFIIHADNAPPLLLGKADIAQMRSYHPARVYITVNPPPNFHMQKFNCDDIWVKPDSIEALDGFKHVSTNALSLTERKTLLKIILAMAVDKYAFDPNSRRNKATGSNKGSIRASTQSIGHDVDEETIRKYLMEAAEEFPTIEQSCS